MQHCNGPTDESLDVFVFSLSLAHSWTTWTSRRLRSAESWTGGYSWPRRFPGWETHIPPHRDTQTHRVVINKRIVFLCNPNGVVLMTNSTEKSHQRFWLSWFNLSVSSTSCFHQTGSDEPSARWPPGTRKHTDPDEDQLVKKVHIQQPNSQIFFSGVAEVGSRQLIYIRGVESRQNN